MTSTDARIAITRTVFIAGALSLLLLRSAPAVACYTGLTVIPTAETVGTGWYAVELEVDGTFPTPHADTYILNTEFGIGDRLEVGVDYDFSAGAEARTLFNAKYVVLGSVDGAGALAVGTCYVGRHSKATPYVVASRDFAIVRGHLGAVHSEGRDRWFVGADRAVDDHVTVAADYVSGEENYASVGVGYDFDDCRSVFAGCLWPNAGGEALFGLWLSFYGPYRRGAAGE